MATILQETETELITRALQADRNAFGELVRVYFSGVINVVYRLCGNTQLAEDAAQEAFIKAWMNLNNYRPGSSFRNWLYRIAVNTTLDILRKENKLVVEDVQDMPLSDGQPGLEALLNQEERAALVKQAVGSLPPSCRAVLVLREYEGLSYREIADTLDIPLGTVMSRLSYARNRLKEMLEVSLRCLEVEYA